MGINTAYVSILFSFLVCRMVLREKTAYAQPTEGIAPNCIGCPFFINSFWALLFKTILSIFDATSRRFIPLQLFRSNKSPFFGKGTNLNINHSSYIISLFSIHSQMKGVCYFPYYFFQLKFTDMI